jgi:hypothetical protein
MLTRAGMAAASALLVTGCAVPYNGAPIATNPATTYQAKLQAAGHWSAMARHMERELEPALRNTPKRPLYVKPLEPTPFNQAVASQLMTSLVNDGYVVAKTPAGALNVEITTQVVEFSPNRPQYRSNGERTALVAGLWVLTDIQPHTAAWLASVAIAGRDAYDWFRSEFASGATPKTEIIVNVGVSDEQRYYARYTSVYYTVDSDRSLYQQLSKSIAVRGD